MFREKLQNSHRCIYVIIQLSFALLFKRLLFFQHNFRRIRYSDALSALFQYKEYFFDNELKVPLEMNDTIIDIGSNIGISCIYFREMYPKQKIIAFEPDPRLYRILKKNTDNLCIESHQIALSKKKGVEKFTSTGADDGRLCKKGDIEVRTENLNFIAKNVKGDIGILKMDIEGMEHDIIPDLVKMLPRIKNLILEYHQLKDEPWELSQFLHSLEKAGFAYYIESALRKKNPFSKSSITPFQMQVNIYARRT